MIILIFPSFKSIICFSATNSSTNQHMNLNPNIGQDGRNKSLVSYCGMILVANMINIAFVPSFLKEVLSVEIGSEWDRIHLILPSIVSTFLIPILFYVSTPKSFKMTKEIIADMF